MRTHVISKRPEPLDWAQLPVATIDHLLWTPDVNICATAQICYDESALYVHLCAKEEHIRAEHTGLIDEVCEDSCLEFFFSPCPGDNRYFNLEFNPNCSMYLGLGDGNGTLIRLLPEGGAPFDPKAMRTEDGWEITYRVPFSFIRTFFPDFSAESGKRIRANFYKCGDATVQPHYFAWNRVTSETPAFHRPCDFGELVFE